MARGHPFPPGNPAHNLVSFEDSYIPEPNSGCWLWIRRLTTAGYGTIARYPNGVKRQIAAHRWAYETHRGPIPVGIKVLHKCDVRLCVNPDHLFLGTQTENIADMDRKGRRGTTRGMCNTNSKLTDDQVRAIRRATGFQREIAATFGVTQTAVSGIRLRITWRHISEEPSDGDTN